MKNVNPSISVLTIIICLVFANSNIQAQKYDNKWMMGYQYAPSTPFPALDFMFGNPDTIGFYGLFPFFGTNTSICNAQGLLQFYSNGVFISNKFDAPLANADSFNIDDITTYSVSHPFDQSAITLPQPGSNHEYLIFHIGGKYIQPQYIPQELRMSKIDMNLQGGAGEMTIKKQVILSDDLTYMSLNAVKHGNGRDWWVVIGEFNSSNFYSVLVTPNGIDTIITSGNLAPVNREPLRGESSFSPDGNLFALTATSLGQTIGDNDLMLYNFDRCSGHFTFRDSLSYPSIADSSFLGCAFSPNSRFLYITTPHDLHQFDLTVASLIAGRKQIATYNASIDPYPLFFNKMQLGPDNKIYMVSYNGSRYLNVINNPDQSDTICNFVQNQLRLVSYHSGSIPTFPHFRLGAATGSGCDTLSTGIQESLQQPGELKGHYLNGNIYLEIPEATSSTGSLEVRNADGRLIRKELVPPQTGQWPYTLQNIYPSDGLYVLSLISGGKRWICKLMVIR